MKRLIATVLLFVSLLSLSACVEISFPSGGEKKETIDRQTFLMERSWGEAGGRQEQIAFTDIEYTNTYYRTKISGKLFYCADDDPDSYEIVEQEVNFRQEHGAIWSATVSVERLGEITVYAHRLGDGYISEAEYQFDGVTMTAIEYRYYREINSLFYANQTYFLYE